MALHGRRAVWEGEGAGEEEGKRASCRYAMKTKGAVPLDGPPAVRAQMLGEGERYQDQDPLEFSSGAPTEVANAHLYHFEMLLRV